MNTRALRLAPLLLVACQATDTGAEPRSIRYLVAQGDFRVALQQARDAWEADPANLELEEDYRFATVAILLERGRQATFDGRDEEALLDFQEALSLAPDAEQAAHWVEKTQLKLSRRWYLAARDLHTADELLEAAKTYEQALMYDPDSVDALDVLEMEIQQDRSPKGGIQRGIESVLEGRIAVVIAQRLSTVRQADRILVIDGGKIVAP